MHNYYTVRMQTPDGGIWYSTEMRGFVNICGFPSHRMTRGRSTRPAACRNKATKNPLSSAETASRGLSMCNYSAPLFAIEDRTLDFGFSFCSFCEHFSDSRAFLTNASEITRWLVCAFSSRSLNLIGRARKFQRIRAPVPDTKHLVSFF